MIVVAASVHDYAIGTALLDRVGASVPTVAKVWVDAGFKEVVVEHGSRFGIDVEIVQREPGAKGFTPQSQRWVVEQTLGTVMLHRRLVRDCETRPASSLAWIDWSMSDLVLLRFTRTFTATWRAPPAPPPAPRRAGAPVRHLLDRSEARQQWVCETAGRLREQIVLLAGQFAAVERTLERLGITRATMPGLATEDGIEPPEPLPPGYREVLAAFEQVGHGFRVKEVCRMLSIGTEPRYTESVCAKVKRLADRDILAEPEPGLVTLTQPAPAAPVANSAWTQGYP